jgi:hypothetical protein
VERTKCPTSREIISWCHYDINITGKDPTLPLHHMQMTPTLCLCGAKERAGEKGGEKVETGNGEREDDNERREGEGEDTRGGERSREN